MKTLEDTERILVTRYTVEPGAADVFDAMPAEFKETISEVHYANGELNVGQQGTYGIEVDDEWLSKILGSGGNQRPSNLIDVVKVADFGLGEYAVDFLPGLSADEITSLDAPVEGSQGQLEEYIGATPYPDLMGPDQGTGEFRYYRLGPVLDQGSEGACTGFCGANFLNCGPLMTRPELTNRDALAIYEWNQDHDEWPGDDYSGSSVTATCKWLQSRGYIEKAIVTDSFEDMVRWKLAGASSGAGGSLMLSTPWYEGMYRTDAQGYIRPTGRHVGGHAILDRGCSQWRAGSWYNSWGRGFGNVGVGNVSEADYRWLIAHGLRAFCAIQVQ